MQRRAIAVCGIVQGVGFRPFVYSLASRLSLTGFVRNAPQGVLIEIEGDPGALARFEAELAAHPPALSTIDSCSTALLPVRGDREFRIESSQLTDAGRDTVRVSPDAATCDKCLEELFDPANRRFRYPFTTCATCGPRVTIITGVPYDRERTTMASFPMCVACRDEYTDPRNGRFHAESIACSECGPAVRLVDAAGQPLPGEPFNVLAHRLRAGAVAAVKGLGGYHLACDATSRSAVGELRRRKHRDEKPFAVMFASMGDVAAACLVSAAARALLTSSARPITLLARLPEPGPFAPVAGVAPGCPEIGAMLPSTPIHHLLVRAVGRPLVMTSGNRSNEPTAYQDDDALRRLAGIADLFLMHDREIRVRCDDGVVRVDLGQQVPVRRSRGDAPRPLRLPLACAQPVLAVGGQLKNTFALGRDREAVVSHHLGDLDDYGAYEAFRRDIQLYEQMFGTAPRVLAHDLHPAYGSTRYALERASREGLSTIGVQHHHAHVASCMAEHGLAEPVIGVAFDGTGYGEDGTVWGGEFLVGDLRAVRRAGHFRPVALPGGEQAIREPWRMALAHSLDAGIDPSRIAERIGAGTMRTVERMIERHVNCPPTSSVGRLFDAVASIAGLRDRVSFEGQAAMQLEWLAAEAGPETGYGYDLAADGDCLVVDTRTTIADMSREAVSGHPPGRVARRFHTTMADIVHAVCLRLRQTTGIDAVLLTGGVFLNVILTRECETRLAGAGFRVFRHRLVPPGDGGISLGQLAVAAARSEPTCA